METFEERLAGHYRGLSARLKQAGDHLLANPVDAASRSLRTMAADAGLPPATFTRLAQALGYPGYDALREALRRRISRQVHPMSDRAGQLQIAHASGDFAAAHLAACAENLDRLGTALDTALLMRAAERLLAARRVVLVGGLGSAAAVEYLAHIARYSFENWAVAGQSGLSTGAAVTGLGAGDAMLIVTKPPFSAMAVRAAQTASAQGAFLVAITDSYACPALPLADAGFVVPTESPHFYSSYVATIALIEVLAGLLVSRAGPTARARIAEVETSLRQVGEVLPD